MTEQGVVVTTDESGDTMKLLRYHKGRYASTDFILDSINNLPTLSLRPDDIMLCSYSKSGCHWLWEIIRLLKAEHSAHLASVDKEHCMIEFCTFDHLAELPSPRILNNHSFFDDQPKDMADKKIKVVFVYRNIKDVAVSFYYHHIRFTDDYQYTGNFSNHLKRCMAGLVDNGNVIDYLKSWEEGILNTPGLDVHVLSYEDMKTNPLEEVKRLSKFLNTSQEESFLRDVVEKTDFSAMKKQKANVSQFIDANGEPIMYRKGEVGDWKNHFTVAESEWVDQVVQKELGNSKLFKFNEIV